MLIFVLYIPKKCVPVYLHTEAPKQQDTLSKTVFTCGRAYKLFVSWKQIDIELQDRYFYIYPYIDIYEPGGPGTRSKGSGIPIVRFYKSVNQNDLFDSKYNKSI